MYNTRCMRGITTKDDHADTNPQYTGCRLCPVLQKANLSLKEKLKNKFHKIQKEMRERGRKKGLTYAL